MARDEDCDRGRALTWELVGEDLAQDGDPDVALLDHGGVGQRRGPEYRRNRGQGPRPSPHVLALALLLLALAGGALTTQGLQDRAQFSQLAVLPDEVGFDLVGCLAEVGAVDEEALLASQEADHR